MIVPDMVPYRIFTQYSMSAAYLGPQHRRKVQNNNTVPAVMWGAPHHATTVDLSSYFFRGKSHWVTPHIALDFEMTTYVLRTAIR